MRKGVEPKTIKEKATKKSTTLAPNMRKSDDQKQKEKIEKDKQQYKQMTKKILKNQLKKSPKIERAEKPLQSDAISVIKTNIL